MSKRKPNLHATTPRERILACAVELFASHGFEAVTMRSLGEAVGLDNSSLYRHFSSKAALLEAALNQVASDVGAALAPHLSEATPSAQWLEDACIALGGHLFDRPANARLMMHWIMTTGDAGQGISIAVPATDRTRPGGQLLHAIRIKLSEGVTQGRLRRHSSPEALVLLVGMIVLRPATYGYFLKTLEQKRQRESARAAWEMELRLAVRGAFAP